MTRNETELGMEKGNDAQFRFVDNGNSRKSRYYDRYIKKCNIWADEHGIDRPKTIALSLNEQIVDVGDIPLEETDEQLDFVLTPSNLF